MFDHVTIRVADLDKSRSFFAGALEPFGVHVVEIDGERGSELAIGPEGSEDLVLTEGEPSAPVHIASRSS